MSPIDTNPCVDMICAKYDRMVILRMLYAIEDLRIMNAVDEKKILLYAMHDINNWLGFDSYFSNRK